MSVQPFATTLFRVPSPLPTPQGRRAQQLKTGPECWIRGLHEASTQGIEATTANLFKKECPGMQQRPIAMLLRPTNVDLPIQLISGNVGFRGSVIIESAIALCNFGQDVWPGLFSC